MSLRVIAETNQNSNISHEFESHLNHPRKPEPYVNRTEISVSTYLINSN